MVETLYWMATRSAKTGWQVTSEADEQYEQLGYRESHHDSDLTGRRESSVYFKGDKNISLKSMVSGGIPPRIIYINLF
jgi:hypothetical protein